MITVEKLPGLLVLYSYSHKIYPLFFLLFQTYFIVGNAIVIIVVILQKQKLINYSMNSLFVRCTVLFDFSCTHSFRIPSLSVSCTPRKIIAL